MYRKIDQTSFSRFPDKIVRIKRENVLDDHILLFKSCLFEEIQYGERKIVTTDEILRLVALSNMVNLCLSSPCLPCDIVNELRCNNDLNINIVVNDEKIVDSYSNVKFSSIKVDKEINFNYIGIVGRESRNFIIDGSFFETDDVIEKIIFKKQSVNDDILSNAKRMIIVDTEGKGDITTALKLLKEHIIECIYVTGIRYYSKEIEEKCNNLGIRYIVSDKTTDGSFVEFGNGIVISLSKLNDDSFLCFGSWNIKNYIGNTYVSCIFRDAEYFRKNIKEKFYILKDGEMKTFTIIENKIISKDVYVESLRDYDYSIFDRTLPHDDEEIENEFTLETYFDFVLKPPHLDDTYNLLPVYDEYIVIINKLKSIKIPDRILLNEEYREIMGKNCNYLDVLKFPDFLVKELCRRIETKRFYDIGSWVEDLIPVLNKVKQAIFFELRNMVIDAFEKDFDTKFYHLGNFKNVECETRIDWLFDRFCNLVEMQFKSQGVDLVKLGQEMDEIIYEYAILFYNKNSSANFLGFRSVDISSRDMAITKLYDFIVVHITEIFDYLESLKEIFQSCKDIRGYEDYTMYEKDGTKFAAVRSEYTYLKLRYFFDYCHIECIVDDN